MADYIRRDDAMFALRKAERGSIARTAVRGWTELPNERAAV